LAAHGDAFELWVPEAFTLQGRVVRRDVAMAVLLDAILGLGFMPDGLTSGTGGATYRYRRQT
jgi:hypothetical protein